MARDKGILTNVDGSDLVNYPNKRTKDNDGSGNGTPVNEFVYGDIHEFFAQMMRLYGIIYNGLPDNTANGYQFVQALVAIASKNDFLLTISIVNASTLSIPLKLSKIKTGESFTCIAGSNRVAQTEIIGSLDTVPSSFVINFKGGNFLTGEYIRVVKTVAGIDMIRLSDGDALNTIAQELNFMKAASQAEEDAGAINTKATTPLTNFTTFSNRVIGAQSGNFLASAIRNGLLSIADKIKIDALAASPFTNRQTIAINTFTFYSSYSNSHTLGGVPFLSQTFIECKVTHTVGGRTYAINEKISVQSQHESENGDLRGLQNTLKAASIDTLLTSIKVFGSGVNNGTNGINIIAANWRIIIEIFR